MKMTLNPRPRGGRFTAPPSKSEAQRALLCAALADAPTQLVCPSDARDIALMCGGLRALGADITRTADGFSVTPLKCASEHAVIDCGESGAVLRFLLPVAGALGVRAEFRRSARLSERPIAPLTELMQAHGCRISAPTEAPLLCDGQLRGGHYAIGGGVSSQFVSGLLLALPLLGQAVGLTLLPPIVSKNYIALTQQVQSRFGVCWEETADGFVLPDGRQYRAPQERFVVGGDWSGAAVWLCLGAISRAVEVRGLDPASLQPDRKILELLHRFGAETAVKNGAVLIAPRPLHGIDAALDGCPDLLPPLAAVAAAAEGTTRFTGIARLRWKESDRPQALAQMLNALGGQAELEGDTLILRGGRRLRGGEVDTCGDHRIAMTAALLSCLCTAPLVLSDAACVEKSYPQFWEHWEGAE